MDTVKKIAGRIMILLGSLTVLGLSVSAGCDGDTEDADDGSRGLVRIPNYMDSDSDLGVSDAYDGNDPNDLDVDGSRSFFPRDPVSRDRPRTTVVPTTQAECEGLLVRAILYENGAPIRTRTAYGVWTSFGGRLGLCHPPSVVLNGI